MKSDRAEMFRVLSAGTRVKIINLLRDQGPQCGTDIARHLGITASAVSQHLHRLLHADLVTRERRGYHVPYAVNLTALEAYHQYVDEVIQRTGVRHMTNLKHEAQELENKLKAVRRMMRSLPSVKSSSS